MGYTKVAIIGYVATEARGAATLGSDASTVGGSGAGTGGGSTSAGAGGGGGGRIWNFGGACGAGFDAEFSGVGAAIAIVGIGNCWGSISLILSTFAFDDGVGVREFSSEIPRPTGPAASAAALLMPLPDLSLFLSPKSLFPEELLLLLLPLSLPLRLRPGRMTIRPVTTPPPCSGALSEIIRSLPSISPDDFFLSLFPERAPSGTRGVGACWVGVSDFFRRDVDSSGGGCCCRFEGLRLGFSDLAEKVGDLEAPVGGLPGANLLASLVDGLLLGAAATLLALDDFRVDSFRDSGAECLDPDGCRALPATTRLDGTSPSADAPFEARRLCLLGDRGAGPSDDDEPEEDDDDEGGGFPFAAGGGPREMGGRHMVAGERARGASRQDSRRNAGSGAVRRRRRRGGIIGRND